MRFPREEPQLGDKKTVWKFLWLPLTIDGLTIWLEYVGIEYEYQEYEGASYSAGIYIMADTHRGWIPVGFIEDNSIEQI